MSEWRARIYRDPVQDPLEERPILQLVRSGPFGLQYVSQTVLVVKTETVEGALPPHGIHLLPEMLEPIRLAIEKMNGLPERSPEAENRVLREWLEAERRRVDEHLADRRIVLP